MSSCSIWDATLDELKVPQAEQGELVALITPLRGDIVDVGSPGDGDAAC